MEPWQFSLFFVALVVGYLLVHLRVVRLEEHLRQLSMLRSVDERLRHLSEVVTKLRPERLEQQLERLHDDLEDLREATQHVQEAVVNIPPPPHQLELRQPLTPAVATPQLGKGAMLQGLVEARLLQLGYRRLNILTDLGGIDPEGEVEVQVECERDRMPVKGRVLVRNGAIRDVALQTVAVMFP